MLQIVFHSDGRRQRSGAQAVVAAAVTGSAGNQGFLFRAAAHLAQAGQSVKLAQKADDRFAMAIGAGECGGNIPHALFHFETFLLQRFAELIHGLEFLESGFGIFPDAVVHIVQKGLLFVDDADRFRLIHGTLPPLYKIFGTQTNEYSINAAFGDFNNPPDFLTNR